MARPWIKLHTSMLGHAPTARLSNDAWRAWVTLLLMAGQRDNGGSAGHIGDLSFHLQTPENEVRALLKALGKRISVSRGGEITVRDWLDWQEPNTSTSRVRRHRAANPNTDRNVTETFHPTKDVTHRREEKRREENGSSKAVGELRKEITAGKPPPPPKPDKPPQPHIALIDAMSEEAGYAEPDYPPNLKAAVRAEKAGRTPEQIRATVRWMRADPDGFWNDKLISMASVVRVFPEAQRQKFRRQPVSLLAETAEPWA